MLYQTFLNDIKAKFQDLEGAQVTTYYTVCKYCVIFM